MRPAVALPLLCLLLGNAAAGEIFRCEDAQGRVHFVDDPSRCEGASPYQPSRQLVPAAPQRERALASSPSGSLEDLLPGAAQIGPSWEITREAGTTQMDPTQIQMGMLEIQARHYGRSQAGVTEVCTIELWRFTDAARASAAEAGAPSGWSFEARGAMLVTLRGTRFQRGQPFRAGLFPDCHKLAALVGSLP